MKLRALSVTELNKYLKKIIHSDPILNNVLVKGEVSNIKYHNSGNIYLSLKDENSKINCIIFSENALNIKFQITNGMKTIIKGYVSTFDRDGLYQIYIKSIEPDGLGTLFLSYEQLRNRLAASGLFNSEKKKAIPFFPNKVAVVTSPTGAAIRDIISVIVRRNRLVNIVIYPVSVQGNNAAKQISDAIDKINTDKNGIDVIILSRGGGSIEELWAFNEEVVAQSIFKSTIPIISAVGHETDFTISDFVSDLRAPTPSAAAEIAVPSAFEIKSRLINANARIHNAIHGYMKAHRNTLYLLNIEKATSLIERRLEEDKHLTGVLHKKLHDSIELYIERLRNKIIQNASKLEVINPFSTLLRGYAMVLDVETNEIVDVDNIDVDDHINVMLTNGMLNCKVLNKIREDKIIGQYIK